MLPALPAFRFEPSATRPSWQFPNHHQSVLLFNHIRRKCFPLHLSSSSSSSSDSHDIFFSCFWLIFFSLSSYFLPLIPPSSSPFPSLPSRPLLGGSAVLFNWCGVDIICQRSIFPPITSLCSTTSYSFIHKNRNWSISSTWLDRHWIWRALISEMQFGSATWYDSNHIGVHQMRHAWSNSYPTHSINVQSMAINH